MKNRSCATTAKHKLNKPTTVSAANCTTRRRSANKAQRRQISTTTRTTNNIPRHLNNIPETTQTTTNLCRIIPTSSTTIKPIRITNTNPLNINQPQQRPLRQFSTNTNIALPLPALSSTTQPVSPLTFINARKPMPTAIITTTTHPIMKFARFFSTTTTTATTAAQPESIDITYIEPSGDVVPLRIKTKDHADDSLMTLAVKNQVDMEGSCDGQLACSTCHCILSQDDYDAFMKLKPPTDEELDMLDTAFGLTPTSRLGCQIPINMLTKNITLTLPKFTR